MQGTLSFSPQFLNSQEKRTKITNALHEAINVREVPRGKLRILRVTVAIGITTGVTWYSFKLPRGLRQAIKEAEQFGLDHAEDLALLEATPLQVLTPLWRATVDDLCKRVLQFSTFVYSIATHSYYSCLCLHLPIFVSHVEEAVTTMQKELWPQARSGLDQAHMSALDGFPWLSVALNHTIGPSNPALAPTLALPHVDFGPSMLCWQILKQEERKDIPAMQAAIAEGESAGLADGDLEAIRTALADELRKAKARLMRGSIRGSSKFENFQSEEEIKLEALRALEEALRSRDIEESWMIKGHDQLSVVKSNVGAQREMSMAKETLATEQAKAAAKEQLAQAMKDLSYAARLKADDWSEKNCYNEAEAQSNRCCDPRTQSQLFVKQFMKLWIPQPNSLLSLLSSVI
eukprot:Skav219559  [mRNA]  locus=scaffold3801:72732:78295:+ [translate_table: standard]